MHNVINTRRWKEIWRVSNSVTLMIYKTDFTGRLSLIYDGRQKAICKQVEENSKFSTMLIIMKCAVLYFSNNLFKIRSF
jgi:hypothetical protein